MTDQQEYRITEETLVNLVLLSSPIEALFRAEEIADSIRARPIPASDASNPEEILPPLVCGCQGYTSCNECHEHARERVAAIAAAAVAEERRKWESDPRLKEIIEQKRGCLTCHNPDCGIWMTADQNCWKSQAEHDARVMAEEREKTITDMCSALESIAVTESWIAMNAFIRSLRGEQK